MASLELIIIIIILTPTKIQKIYTNTSLLVKFDSDLFIYKHLFLSNYKLFISKDYYCVYSKE